VDSSLLFLGSWIRVTYSWIQVIISYLNASSGIISASMISGSHHLSPSLPICIKWCFDKLSDDGWR